MAPLLSPRRHRQLTLMIPTGVRFAATVTAAVLLVWAGLRVMRAGDAHREQLREARAQLSRYASWRQNFTPAARAESLAWRRAWMEALELGVAGDERVELARSISRSAEAAGLRDVRVAIAPPDTTGVEERLSTEGIRREMAPFGVVVECRGDLRSVVAFLGELPPSVAPTDLSLVRPAGRARHRISLAVFQLHFPHGTPLRSSVERRDSRRGGDSGTGG